MGNAELLSNRFGGGEGSGIHGERGGAPGGGGELELPRAPLFAGCGAISVVN